MSSISQTGISEFPELPFLFIYLRFVFVKEKKMFVWILAINNIE